MREHLPKKKKKERKKENKRGISPVPDAASIFPQAM